MRKKNENFIAMYPQNKKDALPAEMAARALDKKYFKQQMNYIVLVQIGNHLIQFVMSFLVSNKAAKIRNRYNQVPHLTQDTNGKVTNSQKTPQTRAKRSAPSQQVTTKHI